MENTLHVIATAGHVDHGKSSLVQRLTGTDPDRFAEEKRRGLTIDLGFAWLTLPSGAEVGFVDVPGHERFVRNMLAGVGPVRLLLFVVAADEGWKPQSEEHLSIVDLLGVDGAVIALTKRDLVDDGTLAAAETDVREHLRGTALEKAETVTCSARTGEGLDELIEALDTMVANAPRPTTELPRARQFIDRVFTIKGAGTVVTGTLTGGSVAVGDEVELYPTGVRARIRGLQSHKRTLERAQPTSRVAVNLAATGRDELKRGDVLALPGQWRPTSTFEARVRPIRGLDHPLTARGAYKLYAGSAERDARIRLYSDAGSPEGAFARIRVTEPLALDVFDRFVLREAGRHETVAGGVVLDVLPPLRQGAAANERLAARQNAGREELPALLVAERGALRASDVFPLTGAKVADLPSDTVQAGDWLMSEALHGQVIEAIMQGLGAFHRENPLREGADLAFARTIASDRLARSRAPADPDLIQTVLSNMETRGLILRTGSAIRLATHEVAAGGPEFAALMKAVSTNPASPPTIAELQTHGFDRDLIEAAVNAGACVRISRELVMTAGFVAEAERGLRDLDAAAPAGITVSAFRERVGTSRKYAVPLLEYFDQRGVTRRRGDVRVLRGR